MANSQDQQYCLRWNNFQANITSQFEALRDDEEFTDVTIACEGKRLQAHKVVLSACSPFFKELFKTNPCSHPIIFMRDVEALHVAALMEFMYAGEVNIAQAHLSSFLKTAESLKIRGLTDTSTESELRTFLNQKPSSSCSNAVSSSQDQDENYHPPEAKRLKPDLADNLPLEVNEDSSKNKLINENSMVNPFAIQHQIEAEENRTKIELPDYMSADEDRGEIHGLNGFFPEFSGGMEIIPQTSNNNKEASTEEAPNPGMNDQISVDLNNSKRLHSLDPRPCSECGRTYSNLSNLRQHIKLIHNPTLSTCQFCQKAFKSDLYLRRHLTNNHSSSTTTNNNNNNNNNSGTNYNNYF